MNLFIILIIIYILSLFILLSNYTHILLTLITLEICIIRSIILLYFILTIINTELFIIFIFIIAVTEGVLGLTIIIIILQYKGIDKIKLINLNLN